MTEISDIERLARDYKRRAEISGKWTDYVKAHGLANFCVVKGTTKNRRKLVYDIEKSWYKGRHPLSYVEHQRLIEEHKSLLKSHRKEIRDDYKQLDAEARKFDIDNVFTEENLDKAQSFSDEVFDNSKKCCQGLIGFSRCIIESSVDLLQRNDLTTPCRFAVIGLGSIAKGEATPYSDLEYAFIVEPGHSEYFEKLAVDSYFRIGNLGETPLKYFDIEELKVAKNISSTTKSDGLPIVSKDIAAGYRIDGLTKKAGNIPTGNGRIDGQSLTLTVEEFIELYKDSAEAPFDGFPGDLSDMLASSVLIYTNEGQTSHLYDEFINARITYESTEAATTATVNQKRFESFKVDVREFKFLPDFAKFQPPNNMHIKIKADIFRYPTLLANNIKMFLGLNNQYSWDSFSYLHTEGILSDMNYRYMNIVLALSIYIRTRAYISYGSQAESLSLMSTIHSPSMPKYDAPAALFILYGNLLSPIKQSITKSVENTSADHLCLTEMTTSMFQSIDVNKTNFFRNAEVCYFAGQYWLAKEQLEKALGMPLQSVSLEHFQQEATQASEEMGSVGKFIKLCCYVLYYTGRYSSAAKYFQWIITNYPDREDIGLLKLLTAHCIEQQGDFQESQRLLNEVEQHFLIQYGKEFHVADSDHEDTMRIYNSTGIVYHAMGEYRKALIYFTKSLRMCKAIYGETEYDRSTTLYYNIGRTYNAQGNHALALEYHLKALDLRKDIFGENPDNPEIASTYYPWIGDTYSNLGNHALALEYHTKSLDMVKAIYGATTNNPRIAISYDGIGDLHNNAGNYALALEYYKKSLDMRMAIYGATTNDPGIANSYSHIGNAQNNVGNHTIALKYHTKSLDMAKDIYGATTSHPKIASTYDDIGNVHSNLGNHALALEYHIKSLDMRKAIYGAATDHPDIATSYSHIGNTHNNVGNHTSALEYHIKSLDMRKAIYGATTNLPDIATSYKNIGNILSNLGNRTLAQEYHTKSLDMRNAIYGVDTKDQYIVSSYNTIGSAQYYLGKHALVLEYPAKFFDTRKSTDGVDVTLPFVANGYSNIGNVLSNLGNYTSSALVYHTKSLDLRKSIYGADTNHPDIAASYNNIGNAHSSLGNHTSALEYRTKSLDLRKNIYSATTNHPDIAASYNNIGNALSDLGNHTLAVEYHIKSLDIKKSVYCADSNHPDIANSYNNIANALSGLGNHTLALEYHTKSLDMRNAIYGATTNHPYIANSYSNIRNVYSYQGNYTSALEYYNKSLQVNRNISDRHKWWFSALVVRPVILHRMTKAWYSQLFK